MTTESLPRQPAPGYIRRWLLQSLKLLLATPLQSAGVLLVFTPIVVFFGAGHMPMVPNVWMNNLGCLTTVLGGLILMVYVTYALLLIRDYGRSALLERSRYLVHTASPMGFVVMFYFLWYSFMMMMTLAIGSATPDGTAGLFFFALAMQTTGTLLRMLNCVMLGVSPGVAAALDSRARLMLSLRCCLLMPLVFGFVSLTGAIPGVRYFCLLPFLLSLYFWYFAWQEMMGPPARQSRSVPASQLVRAASRS